MKILITGASGYIGNKLAHVLANSGKKVHAFIRSAEAEKILQHPNISIFKGDILNKESLSIAIKGCRQVYHTAGFVKLWARNPDIFYQQNVAGTNNVLEAALAEGVNKLVYTSTCGVWGPCKDHLLIENDPRTSSFDNDYDLSKHLAERSVRDYSSKGLFTVIVNPPRVYGPGLLRHSSGVNRLILHLLGNKISTMPWRLETSANYAFIDDVVDGHIQAMEKGLGGERYILGGENVSYKRFADTVKEFSRTKNIYIRIPPFLLKAFSQLELMRGKLNGHEPMITPNVARRIQLDKIFDCSKAIKQLGYRITPFEEGMKITIDHLKNNHYEKY
jgi:nucleoside-diphosphate-sugar epimerase